jgi:hypothetical protein
MRRATGGRPLRPGKGKRLVPVRRWWQWAVEVEANGMAAEWHPQLVLLLLLTTIARNQRILHEPSCTSEGKP